MPTNVTSKGQVTIPKPVRDHLGVTAGSAVDFVLMADGRVVVTKVKGKKPPASRFARVRGSAAVKLGTDEIMAMTRGDD